MDDLLEHYCQNLKKIGGYLTNHGDVDMQRAAYILFLVGEQEEKLLGVPQGRAGAWARPVRVLVRMQTPAAARTNPRLLIPLCADG